MLQEPVAAIVLCAGQSQRMRRPKALLQWQGRSFLAHVIGLAQAQELRPVLAIEGAYPLAREIQALGADCVHHPRWADGPFSSLQAGVLALIRQGFAGSGAVLLTIDRPRIAAATLSALRQHIDAEPETVWQPTYNDQRAHPIYLPSIAWPALLAHPPTGTLREVLRDLAIKRATFVCDDPAVLENIDTPQALQAAGIDDGGS